MACENRVTRFSQRQAGLTNWKDAAVMGAGRAARLSRWPFTEARLGVTMTEAVLGKLPRRSLRVSRSRRLTRSTTFQAAVGTGSDAAAGPDRSLGRAGDCQTAGGCDRRLHGAKAHQAVLRGPGARGPGQRRRYIGQVGTGCSHKGLEPLDGKLVQLKCTTSPFAARVTGESVTTWIRPFGGGRDVCGVDEQG